MWGSSRHRELRSQSLEALQLRQTKTPRTRNRRGRQRQQRSGAALPGRPTDVSPSQNVGTEQWESPVQCDLWFGRAPRIQVSPPANSPAIRTALLTCALATSGSYRIPWESSAGDRQRRSPIVCLDLGSHALQGV